MFADSQADPDTDSSSSGTETKTGTVKVWLEDGIIHQRFIGNQTGETVREQTRQTDEIVAQLQAKREPVLALSNFTDIGDHTQEARDAMKNDLSTRYFDRAAAFGLSPTLRIIGELMLNITGKKDQVQIFETKEQAESWLREFSRAR